MREGHFGANLYTGRGILGHAIPSSQSIYEPGESTFHSQVVESSFEGSWSTPRISEKSYKAGRPVMMCYILS